MMALVRHNRINQFLEDKSEFEVLIDTDTRISKNRKLLLGSHNSSDIHKIAQTVASYSLNRSRILRASYSVKNELLNGIGVIDEWREFPTEDFNVYGFVYDTEFEDFSLELSKTTLNGEEQIFEEVLNPVMDAKEKLKLGSLCLYRAYIDLASNKELLVVQ